MHHQAFSIHLKNDHSDFSYKRTPSNVKRFETGNIEVSVIWQVTMHQWATGTQHFETNTLSRYNGYQSSSDPAPHTKRTETSTALLQKPTNSQV
jgi:hypothetical protein